MKSGLKHLVDGIKAHLTAHAVTAVVAVGARELARQDNQGPGRANRIVIVPYDPKSGDAGTLAEPELVGDRDIYDEDGVDPEVRLGTTRALADWQRPILVSVWAFDAAAPEDELLQEVALEDLLEAAIRAFHHVGLADVAPGKISRVVPTTRHFGAEARFITRFTSPIYDHPIDVGYPELVEIDKG